MTLPLLARDSRRSANGRPSNISTEALKLLALKRFTGDSLNGVYDANGYFWPVKPPSRKTRLTVSGTKVTIPLRAPVARVSPARWMDMGIRIAIARLQHTPFLMHN